MPRLAWTSVIIFLIAQGASAQVSPAYRAVISDPSECSREGMKPFLLGPPTALLAGSRLGGADASSAYSEMVKKGATESLTLDVLGVVRGRVYQLELQQEIHGDAKDDPCAGETTYRLIQTCTVAADASDLNAACETHCVSSWKGQDCR